VRSSAPRRIRALTGIIPPPTRSANARLQTNRADQRTPGGKYLVGPVDAVTHRDPALGAKDYHQFVTCPVCGDRLRLHSRRGVLSIAGSGSVQVPGGQFVRLAPVHIIDDS
jgi:hypothetical protein